MPVRSYDLCFLYAADACWQMAADKILHDNPDVQDPTPEEARRIRNKCLMVMVPFYAITYLQFNCSLVPALTPNCCTPFRSDVCRQAKYQQRVYSRLAAGLKMGQDQYNNAVTAFVSRPSSNKP